MPTKAYRKLNLLPPLRGKLELKYLGRKYIEENFYRRGMQSLVLSEFIN